MIDSYKSLSDVYADVISTYVFSITELVEHIKPAFENISAYIEELDKKNNKSTIYIGKDPRVFMSDELHGGSKYYFMCSTWNSEYKKRERIEDISKLLELEVIPGDIVNSKNVVIATANNWRYIRPHLTLTPNGNYSYLKELVYTYVIESINAGSRNRRLVNNAKAISMKDILPEEIWSSIDDGTIDKYLEENLSAIFDECIHSDNFSTFKVVLDGDVLVVNKGLDYRIIMYYENLFSLVDESNANNHYSGDNVPGYIEDGPSINAFITRRGKSPF